MRDCLAQEVCPSEVSTKEGSNRNEYKSASLLGPLKNKNLRVGRFYFTALLVGNLKILWSQDIGVPIKLSIGTISKPHAKVIAILDHYLTAFTAIFLIRGGDIRWYNYFVV